MGKPSAPSAPDPVQTAQAQTASNVATATANAGLNRVDQYTPWGSSTYNVEGNNPDGTPKYSQAITLSPDQQQLLDMTTQGQKSIGQTALGQLDTLKNTYGSPLDTSSVPGIASTVPGQEDSAAAIRQAQDAAYRGQTQYLDPRFEQDQQTLDAKLANFGLSTGSRAYDNAQQNFALQKRQAYQSAQDSAVGAGNEQQNRLFGQDLSKANLQNSANAQQLQQLFALRNQPLNEYNSLATGAQVQSPNFNAVPTTNMANTDISGITNDAFRNQMGIYQQKMAGYNNLFNLGGAVAAAAIKSDRRVKRDIRRVGTTPGGIPTYQFRYNGDDDDVYFGVMADEVLPVIPEAVIMGDDGFYRVDYSRVR
jgi:hypothetical protein